MRQPFLMLGADGAGLCFVNGRLVGEIHAGERLCVPVSPRGRVLLTYLPMADDRLPVACALTFSEGMPVAESVTRGIYVIAWPGGAVDVDFAPAPVPTATRTRTSRPYPDLEISLTGDVLTLTGHKERCTLTLPGLTQLPRVRADERFVFVEGENNEQEEVLVVMSRDLKDVLLSVTGREARMTDDGVARVVEDLRDTVGHAYLKTFLWTDGGFRMAEPEMIWADGAPHWPGTPETTCVAAVEAYRLGRMDEALSFFTPGARLDDLEALPETLPCVPLAYPVPGMESRAGLVRALSDRVAEVRPLLYHAQRMSGPQGAWRLTGVRWENGAENSI